MRKSLVLTAALICACNSQPPELLPPPFGPDHPQDTRLFFPTGLAETDAGLLVANGNFNRAFESGTVVLLPRDYVDNLLAQDVDCDVDALTLATAAKADTENNDEKRKARYNETAHVKKYYQVNRYPAK